MTYTVMVKFDGGCYVHQRGHTKEKAEYIAKLLNDNYDRPKIDAVAYVVPDNEVKITN